MLVCLYNISPFLILYCKYNASLYLFLRFGNFFSIREYENAELFPFAVAELSVWGGLIFRDYTPICPTH